MTKFWYVLLALIVAGRGLDVLYRIWIALRRWFWERGVVRGADGVLDGAASYTRGQGAIALLFLHGFADTPQLWQRMIDNLVMRGVYTCRALRWAGAAASAHQARQEQHLAIWRKQLEQEVAALRTRHEQVWLIGHSLGGALALDGALRLQGVSGVIVFAPLLEVARARSPGFSARTWFRLGRLLLPWSPFVESPFNARAQALDEPQFSYQRDRFIAVNLYRMLFRLIDQLHRCAGVLSVPVLTFLPLQDRVVESAQTRQWLQRVAPQATVTELPQASHILLLEEGWQELCAQTDAFIQQAQAASGTQIERGASTSIAQSI